MDVKYQVFVSSTYIDLVEERRKVTEAILNLGHIPIGMEAFQASDDSQWDYIKRRIDESDYYVVIVAERYGSESNGKSYTQMEYEYAVAQSVPVAAFLLSEEARKTWPNAHVEHDKKKKLEKFRALCQKKLCKHWGNPDELGGKVILALNELTRTKPRTGWVRASALPSENVLNELVALSDEKRVLQERLAVLGDNEQLRIPDHVLWRITHLSETFLSEILDYQYFEGELSLLELFEYCVSLLAEGCRSKDIKEQIEAVENAIYEMEAPEGFLLELISNNIVRAESFYPHGYGNIEVKTYYLSDYGKEFLMYTKEWRKREKGKRAVPLLETDDATP